MPKPSFVQVTSASSTLTDYKASSLQSPLSPFSQIPSASLSTMASRSSLLSDSQGASPRLSKFTFFDADFRVTGRRQGHINVVNMNDKHFLVHTIFCDNENLADFLCSFIPRADRFTMDLLALLQTLRLESIRLTLAAVDRNLEKIESLILK